MKHFLLFLWLILLCAGMNDRLYAQERQDTPTRLLRIYEDNDFLNIRGRGTDDAYTNGTRIEVFYSRKRPSRFILDRLLPKAGDSSVNVYGWGVMELMFTPDDITNPGYQPDDYPWSASLTAMHTLFSYDPRKKYDLQTELVLGVMGPAALGEQTQSMIHRLIHYLRPEGWDHQYRNALLLNINFTAEKQLATWGPNVEVIAGSQAFVGSMMNGVTAYPLIRIGRLNPYFDGFFSQYSSAGRHGVGKRRSRLQAYFVLKPEAGLILTNALLEGGLFTTNPNMTKGTGKGTTVTGRNDRTDAAGQAPRPYHDLRRVIWSVNYGAVVSSGHFGISFIQNTSSSMMKGLYNHEVGNLSVYYAW